MKRILVIHDNCKVAGGSNNYRKRLCENLKKRDIEIALFTHAVENSEDETPYYCYNYRGSIKFIRHIEYFYFNPSLVSALRQWIHLIKPDLIHIHHAYLFPTSVLLACKGKIPIVQTVHDFRIFCMLEGKRTRIGETCQRCLGAICNWKRHPLLEFLPQNLLKRLLHKVVNCFIVPSRAIEDDMKRLGFRTFFLPHFVDYSHFPETSLDKNRNNILFVGYLYYSKGLHVLLRAISRIVAAFPSITLDIVGNGPHEDTLKDLCISLNLKDHVRFCGEVSYQELPSFYSRANIVVLPSIVIENSPLTIYEAMAACRPVIASRIGGIPELIIPGENGLLFSPGDDEELSRNIVELLQDHDKAERMGIIGKKLAESLFSPERHIEKYLELVNSLVSMVKHKN